MNANDRAMTVHLVNSASIMFENCASDTPSVIPQLVRRLRTLGYPLR
jgi:hypothetical protein